MEFLASYISRFFQVLKFGDLVDIAILAVVIYQAVKVVRETRAIQLIKGKLIIFAALFLSEWLNLHALNYLLGNIVQVGLFAVVVIFQPELRNMLERVGRSKAGRMIDMVAGKNDTGTDIHIINELC